MFCSSAKPTCSPAFLGQLAALLLATCALPALAQGNILINPGRVILSGSERSAELTLVNTGETSVTYRLELIDRRMTEVGGLIEVEQPAVEDRSARSMIRHAPRQVTLDGGSRQTVRLLVRKPAGLKPGEYRSHLLLRALPQAPVAADVERSGEDHSKLSFQVTMLPSLSIPVIVRHGEIERRTSLSEATLSPAVGDEPAVVSVRLHREGNSSVYGDLVATWIPARGKELEVSRLGGVAIYPPITGLDYRLPLHLPAGKALAGGRLQVRFASHPGLDHGAPPVSDEAEIVVR